MKKLDIFSLLPTYTGILGLIVWLSASCQNQQFQAGGSQKQATNTQANANEPLAQGAAAGAACDDKTGMTQATLLSTTFDNGKPGNFLEYELTLTDCAGKQRSFSADVIMFDWDIQAHSFNDYPYTVSSQDNSLQGKLVHQMGHDLFNKVGPIYGYNQTDQVVSFATGAATIHLRINMLGVTVLPYPNTAAPGADFMATYLRFGQAAPVTNWVKVIGMVNPQNF